MKDRLNAAVMSKRSTPRRYTPGVLLAAGAIILAILPLLTARHLPLLDAPAHEARLMILKQLLAGKPSHFYNLGTFLLPNVAFDVIGIGLVHVMSPESAGKVFFALTLVLTLGGVALLNRATWGRWSITPLFAALLLYNLVTILGFMSYSFGVALAFWALAFRLILSRSHPIGGVWAGAACVVVLLLCHLFAVVIYVSVVSGFILAAVLRKEISLKLAILRLMEPVPAGMIYLSMPSLGLQRLRYAPHFMLSKGMSIAKAITAASILGDMALVLGTFCFFLLLIITKRVRIAADFIPGLGILFLLYIILPAKVGSGAYVDSRIPIVIMFLVLAGLNLNVQWTRWTQALVTIIAVALIVKQVAIAALWASFDPQIDALLSAVRSLPTSSIVTELECEPNSLTDIMAIYRNRQPPLTHIASLAAVERGIFLPTDFAIRGQQPISVAAPYRPYAAFQNRYQLKGCDPELDRRILLNARALQEALQNSGRMAPSLYFLLLHPAVPNALATDAHLLAAGKDFELYGLVNH